MTAPNETSAGVTARTAVPTSVAASPGSWATAALRVAVDGRELTGTGRYSGLGTMSRRLLGALAARDGLRVRVLTTDPTVVPEGVEPVRMWRQFHERRRSVYEHEALISLDLARTRADVVYSPVLSGVPFTHRPYVQTLHDVIPLAVPGDELVYLRRWWSRWARWYRRADAVVTVSRFSADDGIRILGLDPRRVHVAHNGVADEFVPRPRAEPDEPPYLLTVSEYSARKRFGDAFAVAGALADAGYPHRLEAAGRVQPQYREEVEALVRAAPRADRVIVRGYVDDLPELYRGASVFLFCSRYEGFGLPLIEAMASGVPVVSYANSSLVEVVGDAGILVPDGDVAAMTAAVRSLLDDRRRWGELREAGLERARRFTWSACAETYADVLAAVADR